MAARKSRKAPAAEPVAETMDAGVPAASPAKPFNVQTQGGVVQMSPELFALAEGLVNALHDVSKAIREVGFALIAQEPVREVAPKGGVLPPAPGLAGQTRDAKAAAVSLPPSPVREQGEHGGSPKQPSVPAPEPKKPAAGPATLQQAQQAVLAHAAKNGSPATQAILAKLGVDRVSNIKDPAKYAEVVAALS